MSKAAMMLGLALVSCGNGGGGEDDAASDGTIDTTDTAGDAADTATDTPAQDTAGDEATDTPAEAECATDGDCDDADPCTSDRCDLDTGECANDPLDADGDGHVDILCGGDDCSDDDSSTFLGECAGVNDCCDGCWQRNGCWVDPTTDLMWEDPPSGGYSNWDEAVAYCDALSLAGHGAGEWHMPTISELRTLVRGCPATEDSGACGVTDACLVDACSHDCDGCSDWGGPGASGCYWDPALEGVCSLYWSSSSHELFTSYTWYVLFDGAFILYYSKSQVCSVRCVRPGS